MSRTRVVLRKTSTPREGNEEDEWKEGLTAQREDEVCVKGAMAVRTLQFKEERERGCHGGRGGLNDGIVKRAITNSITPQNSSSEACPRYIPLHVHTRYPPYGTEIAPANATHRKPFSTARPGSSQFRAH